MYLPKEQISIYLPFIFVFVFNSMLNLTCKIEWRNAIKTNMSK